MRISGWFLLPICLVAGCGSGGGSTPTTVVVTKGAAPKDVTSLTGPAGKVKIGDSLDQAKKAFPAPKGAQIYNSAMSFAIVTKDGWAWATESGPRAFEAAVKDGKVAALSLISTSDEGEPAKSLSEFGKPTRKADGKTVSAYVWESGKVARFLVDMKKPLPMMPFRSMLIIGDKDDLKMVNYQAGDPALFVKQLDSASEQLNSPEMRKAFEEAKKKALEKRNSNR